MIPRGAARVRLGAALLAPVALIAGTMGIGAPAIGDSTPAPATDRVLITEAAPYPNLQNPFQPQSRAITGPGGAVWFTYGLNDVVRLSDDGTYTRFNAYPAGGLSWVGSHLVPDDQGGVTYEVSVGENQDPHLMHLSADGTATEIAQPAGATEIISLTSDSNGTVWYEGSWGTATSGLIVRVAHGVAQAIPVAGRIGDIVPTDDGGAWVSVLGTLTRIAPDGSLSVPEGMADRHVGYLWPGAGGSVWYIGFVSGDGISRAGSVQLNGTVSEAQLGADLSLVLPVTRQADRSGTWVEASRRDGTVMVFAGTTPSTLQAITLPLSGARQFSGVESNGRLVVALSESTDLTGTDLVYSLGLDGTVQTRASLPGMNLQALAADPDGTVWLGGNVYQGGHWGDTAPLVALRADGTVVRGGVDAPYSDSYAFDGNGRLWLSTNAGFARVTEASSSRIAGADRYAAAAAISTAAFPAGASVAYVASGQNFPDALSAGPLAAADSGPLLLTAPDALPKATHDALVALGPSKVVVVGGTSSVSDTVLAQLRSIVPTVTRIAGPDRYAVSRDIVAAHQQAGKPLFVATGAGYADAVTAGAAAARAGGQLLLVPGDQASLPSGYAAFIRGLAPSSIAVVGGPATVSDGILTQLDGIASATRYGGSDRYAVSTAVLRAFGSPSAHVYLTTGQNFPDALAAAPLAGRSDSTLVSVPDSCVPGDSIDAIGGARPTAVTVLGGTDSVSAGASWLAGC